MGAGIWKVRRRSLSCRILNKRLKASCRTRVNYLKVVQVSTLESLIKLLAVKTSNPQELLKLPITSSNCILECVSTP